MNRQELLQVAIGHEDRISKWCVEAMKAAEELRSGVARQLFSDEEINVEDSFQARHFPELLGSGGSHNLAADDVSQQVSSGVLSFVIGIPVPDVSGSPKVAYYRTWRCRADAGVWMYQPEEAALLGGETAGRWNTRDEAVTRILSNLDSFLSFDPFEGAPRDVAGRLEEIPWSRRDLTYGD